MHVHHPSCHPLYRDPPSEESLLKIEQAKIEKAEKKRKEEERMKRR